MPTPPLQYDHQYYMPQHHQMPPPQYPPQMSPQQLDQSMHAQLHSPQQQIPIDPTLQLYYPTYNPYQQQQQPGQPSPHQQQISPMHPPPPPMHPQLSLPAHSPASSSSTQGSDYMGTPPADSISTTSRHSTNGKRSSSSTASGGASGSRKKSKMDDGGEDGGGMSPATEAAEGKVKATRGSRCVSSHSQQLFSCLTPAFYFFSRACTVCRRLKMKCVGAEQGPPCKRCQAGNHECIFEESNRGKRSSK